MFFRRMRKDRKGLTLVELICAVAILGVISATVGGAMVVATNTYRSGTVETAMQSEAQFTINSIESLIIDATNTVEFTGDTLTITNVDYTYVITYYPAPEQELRYTQFDTATGSTVVSNELLAEHVTHFNAFTDDFPVTRNVRLELTLENQGRSFTTAYNVTSRNNPEAGAPPVVATVINVNHDIVLEPNDVYTLPVSVLGAPGAGFSASLVPEADHASYSTATVVPGGVELRIHETETGGGDEKLYLNIVASDGTPTQVMIRIRRVYDNALGVTFPAGIAQRPGVGTFLQANSEYTVTAQVVGSNLDPVPATDYDRDYSPYTKNVKWSFEVLNGDGGDGDSYAQLVNDVDNGDGTQTLTFRLKKDLAVGTTLKVWATALHPEGTYSVGGSRTNKNGVPYGVGARDFVKLEAPAGGLYTNSDLRRGIEGYVYSDLDKTSLIEQEWQSKNPGGTMPPSEAYNGGFQGNIYFRYKSTDGTHTSNNYPEWIRMADQGDGNYFKFNASDFNGMKYMKDYDIEILYSFKYSKGNNQQAYYPEAAYPGGPNGTQQPLAHFANESQYVYTFPLRATAFRFGTYRDGSNVWRNIEDSYKTADATGIGTFDRPLQLQFGTIDLKVILITGATTARGPEEIILRNHTQLYAYVGGTWQFVSNNKMEYKDRVGDDEFNLHFEPQNGTQLQRGVKYKIVLGTFDENDPSETYAYEPVDGQGGRGVVYFELY